MPTFSKNTNNVRTESNQLLSNFHDELGDLAMPSMDRPVYRAATCVMPVTIHSVEKRDVKALSEDMEVLDLMPTAYKRASKPVDLSMELQMPTMTKVPEVVKESPKPVLQTEIPSGFTIPTAAMYPWPKSCNAAEINHGTFEAHWRALLASINEMQIKDFSADVTRGDLTVTFWGNGTATKVNVMLYQESSGAFTLDFQKLRGDGFDFHNIRSRMIAKINDQEPALLQKELSVVDPTTGKDLFALDVVEQDVDEWISTLPEANLEFKREISSLIAEASQQETGCKLMSEHKKSQPELFRVALDTDQICARYALVTLQNVLKMAQVQNETDIHKIRTLAGKTNSEEIRGLCQEILAL